jgi:hypothetical protein
MSKGEMGSVRNLTGGDISTAAVSVSCKGKVHLHVRGPQGHHNTRLIMSFSSCDQDNTDMPSSPASFHRQQRRHSKHSRSST